MRNKRTADGGRRMGKLELSLQRQSSCSCTVRRPLSAIHSFVLFIGLLWSAFTTGAAQYSPVVPGHDITFPRDHGSHPDFKTEWWYVTGWLEDEDGEPLGFQLTFFRTRTGVDEGNPSQFAARQLLFAHAAISDPKHGSLQHSEKIAREGFALAQAAVGKLDVSIDRWQLRQVADDQLQAVFDGGDFAATLDLRLTQPPLLQGQDGFSQKGPQLHSASYYYSLPQLQASGSVRTAGRTHRVKGIAWLDHEWWSSITSDEVQGWDWLGLNLEDGGAIMALQIRDRQGRKHWAGGTYYSSAGTTTKFAAPEVHWSERRRWRSARTRIEYPIEWRIQLGERSIVLAPLLDDQENDARASTGTIYWEGAVRAYDEDKRLIGRGYLEMTGYGERVRF